MNGGQLIGHGGFGCVFYPNISCKNNKKTRKNNKQKIISKLSLKNEVKKEMNIYKQILPIIISIPNYNKYFLINNIYSCEPKIINKENLKDLDKCYFLKALNIDKNNINNNLNKLNIINIPYGGEELYKIFEKLKYKIIERFDYYNLRFYNLLKYAIIPMNNLNLYHTDIKSNNLLLNKFGELKIIDWALAIIYKKNHNINNVRGFQFNLPFSSIIFNIDFTNEYLSLLNKNKNDSMIEVKINNFILNYIEKFYIDKNHVQYTLTKIFPLISNIENINLDIKFIVEYISNILINFTDFKLNKFNEKKYYNLVYLKNCDIWGFLTIYFDILLLNKDNNKFNKKILTKFILKYLYTINFASQPIPHLNLLKDIKKLKLK